jgi:hypothetical protein
MSDQAAAQSASQADFQALFQQRWPQLRQPDVRNLAWLLDSPILLNPAHPRWRDQVAQLPEVDARCVDWLTSLDRAPQPLLDHLALHPHTRLGHYAENLLAWYFAWNGTLEAHSVQVRAHTTIGEFDFLLNLAGGLEHWEFACKFYLQVDPGTSLSHLVGPNLADNLHDKSVKIIDSQLALGRHEHAGRYLPAKLMATRVLLKGWLFYPIQQTRSLPELWPNHCRGAWCRISELDRLGEGCYAVLTRLRWLAPARFTDGGAFLSMQALQQLLGQQFAVDDRPVLVVSLDQLEQQDGDWIERRRIFVVPDNWNQPT